MIKISSIKSLFELIINHHGNEWVYINLNEWKNNPCLCEFYIISDKEVDDLSDDEVYESEAGPFLPISCKHLDLYPWMTADVLEGIYFNLKGKTKNDDLIAGIEYYREFDDFLDGEKIIG
jgi:hypothetical protein